MYKTFQRCFCIAKSRNTNLRKYAQPSFISKKMLTRIAIYSPIYGISYYTWSNNKKKNYIGGGIRFFRSVKIGVAISVDYWWSVRGLDEKSGEYLKALKKIHLRSAKRILTGCLLNGGFYIKLGQGLVSMDHVLPVEYINVLKILQDQCLKRDIEELETLFMEEFGVSHKELFAHFNEIPIASASLAQVYKATTKDGQQVAVKAQYIDLQTRFHADISTVKMLLDLIQFMHPKFSFRWILDDLSGDLEQELDFINEAKNSERCAEELKSIKEIYVPRVHWDLTTKRVLTAEFIDGCKISDTKKISEYRVSLKKVDSILINAFAEQIFHSGFVHADPHPGNIFIRKTSNNKTQIVLLDHGLYKYIPPNVRIPLCNLWKHIVVGDHKGMREHAKLLGVTDFLLLAEMLTQRPLRINFGELTDVLTNAEYAYMNEKVSKKFDKITETLKLLPREILFIIRNINLVRAITHEHGNLIDRYGLMARSATRGAFFIEGGSLLQNVRGSWEQLKFDFFLRKQNIYMWFTKKIFYLLHLFGKAPSIEEFMVA